MLKKLNKIRKEITPSLIPAILPSLSTFAVINASVFSGYIAAQNATNVMSGEEKIDISGIDRLFFKVTTGTITANDEFYAAVNTLPTI